MSKDERATVKAQEEYLATRRRCLDTAGDDVREALPGLRRSARSAWDHLVKVSAPLSPASREAYAWALHSEEFSFASIGG